MLRKQVDFVLTIIPLQTTDFISFDPRLITENNFHDDNRPYRYE